MVVIFLAFFNIGNKGLDITYMALYHAVFDLIPFSGRIAPGRNAKATLNPLLKIKMKMYTFLPGCHIIWRIVH